MIALSNSAVVTLLQLKEGAAESGDLISKCGRDELFQRGLCRYVSRGKGGEWELNSAGAQLAAFFHWGTQATQ